MLTSSHYNLGWRVLLVWYEIEAVGWDPAPSGVDIGLQVSQASQCLRLIPLCSTAYQFLSE